MGYIDILSKILVRTMDGGNYQYDLSSRNKVIDGDDDDDKDIDHDYHKDKACPSMPKLSEIAGGGLWLPGEHKDVYHNVDCKIKTFQTRNQVIDMHCKSIGWSLYDGDINPLARCPLKGHTYLNKPTAERCRVV